jgi:hypothetical protein
MFNIATDTADDRTDTANDSAAEHLYGSSSDGDGSDESDGDGSDGDGWGGGEGKKKKGKKDLKKDGSGGKNGAKKDGNGGRNGPGRGKDGGKHRKNPGHPHRGRGKVRRDRDRRNQMLLQGEREGEERS